MMPEAVAAIRPEMVTELRALAEAATIGPWHAGHFCRDDHSCECPYIFGGYDRMGAIASIHVDDGKNDCPPDDEAKSNQRYIAAASPDVVLALIERIGALEADNARLREALEPFADQAATFDSDGAEFVPDEFHPSHAEHTIGDLRRARSVSARSAIPPMPRTARDKETRDE